MQYHHDPNQLEVYVEIRKRRQLVGILAYHPEQQQYTFTYETAYLYTPSPLAVGPEFPVTKQQFVSKRNQLFPTFLDRIPPKANPAYKEYCKQQGISPEEDNKIILLSTIGRRGPSSFIYEPIFRAEGSVKEALHAFQQALELSYWDIAMIFDISEVTLQKIMTGKSQDKNTLRIIEWLLAYPQLLLDQLTLTGKRVHRDTRTRVYRYCKAK